MSEKRVYFFGGGKAEGNAKMKELLGGKGANLAEMTNLGVPVPPGFTIGTKVCDEYYRSGGKWPSGLGDEVDKHLAKLEKAMNARPIWLLWLDGAGQHFAAEGPVKRLPEESAGG